MSSDFVICLPQVDANKDWFVVGSGLTQCAAYSKRRVNNEKRQDKMLEKANLIGRSNIE